MSNTARVIEYITQHGPVTNADIAQATGVAVTSVAAITTTAYKREHLTRESDTSPAGRVVYRYGPRKVTTHQPVSKPDAPAPVAVSKPDISVSSPLDAQLEALAVAVATTLANRVKTLMIKQLAGALPVAEAPIDIGPLLDKLKNRTATQEKARKPQIGVVGLLPVQAGEISAEFADCIDLRFWNDGEPRGTLKSMAENCEAVFIHTRHAGHATDQYLVTNGANIRRVTGGVSNLKDAMTTYFVERK